MSAADAKVMGRRCGAEVRALRCYMRLRYSMEISASKCVVVSQHNEYSGGLPVTPQIRRG
jgi:hypothetical protein